MAVGVYIGSYIAMLLNIRHDLIFGICVGLLFSLYHYSLCFKVLQSEYKRLKSKKDNEANNIS